MTSDIQYPQRTTSPHPTPRPANTIVPTHERLQTRTRRGTNSTESCLSNDDQRQKAEHKPKKDKPSQANLAPQTKQTQVKAQMSADQK